MILARRTEAAEVKDREGAQTATAMRRGDPRPPAWTRCSPTRRAARCGGCCPGRAAVKLAGKLATRPDTVVTRGAQLAGELAKIAVGRSELEAAKGDRRFKDEAWSGNPAFRRLLQSYLATGSTVDGLIGDAGLDWRSERQVRFAAENVLDALAPSNAPLTNPAVLKAALDTGGQNFVARRGQLRARHVQAAADPVDGRHVGVHGRRGHRGHAGRGRAAQPGVRAAPVQAADLEGARAAAAAHAADDQQVLHRRPRAGAQHARVRGQARPAGVRHLVAQPERAPRRLGPRHLRERGARGAGRRRGDHRQPTTPTCSACAPAGSCSPPSSRTSRPRASRTGSRA